MHNYTVYSKIILYNANLTCGWISVLLGRRGLGGGRGGGGGGAARAGMRLLSLDGGFGVGPSSFAAKAAKEMLRITRMSPLSSIASDLWGPQLSGVELISPRSTIRDSGCVTSIYPKLRNIENHG
jgi:hypothetical protein